MSDVNVRCVSLANGTLEPDLRVNYEFGLVLGVNEFRQEQEYFLEKDYLYNRALHGYGTVYGLQVLTSPLADNNNEAVVTVKPGMAIDQYGRPVVVRNDQCARLGTWLAKQEQKNPGIIAQHQGPSGDLHIYVVASYDECEDALVPIPGQPCSSSDTTQAPSRIRDSYNIELRWELPSMPAYDALQRFAKLLEEVRFEPGLPEAQSDEEAIISLVRSLGRPINYEFGNSQELVQFNGPIMRRLGQPGIGKGTSPTVTPTMPKSYFKLPAETACAVLDRIYAVWVTEVRPRFLPDLTNPAGSGANPPEAGVLLATIDFLLQDDSYTNPKILDPATIKPSNEGRPVLLHTQLIQELLCGRNGVDQANKKELEFATLQLQASHILRAWIHNTQQLVFPPDPQQTVVLSSGNKRLNITRIDPVKDLFNAFDIVTNPDIADEIEPGSLLQVNFRLDQIRIRNAGPLLPTLNNADFDYVNRADNLVTVFGMADQLPVIREFVTVSTFLQPQFTTRAQAATPQLLLWFHTDSEVQLPKQIEVLRNATNTRLNFEAVSTDQNAFSFTWRLVPPADATPLSNGEPLTIFFDTAQVLVGNEQVNQDLNQTIKEQRQAYIGYNGSDQLQAFYRSRIEIPPGVNREALANELFAMPTLPFVTITQSPNRDVPSFELWFHLSVDPTLDQIFIAKIPEFKVFAEPGGGGAQPQEVNFSAPVPVGGHRNIFNFGLDRQSWDKVKLSLYLRLIFPLSNPLANQQGQNFSLRDYIRNPTDPTNQNNIATPPIKFEGHNGQDSIVAYVRVTGFNNG